MEYVTAIFDRALAPLAGPPARQAWMDTMDMLSHGIRRPVIRHALDCHCAGADEAVVARVLTLAAQGARADAMLVLALLVSGDRMLLTIDATERAGLAVMRISQRKPVTAAATVH